MAGTKKLGALLSTVPLDKDDVMSYGVSLFLNELDPEDITIKWYENGWELQVKTDEENTEKMREFWEENIEPKL